MAIRNTDLLPLGRGQSVYKIEINDLTNHQKNTFVELDGDIMQGPLKTLPPTQNEDASNKLYVDTEVQKVVDQLNDIVDQRSEGIYGYKIPGFNGSAPRPPGNGEYYLQRSQNNDYTPLYESADEIYISHHTSLGETNNLADIKVGEYMQFNIASTADSYTYIVDGVNHSANYSVFTVTFNRKTSDLLVRPSDGDTVRLQSYHIDGIDVDDLNASLDDRYVSTSGDIVSGSIALGDVTVRSGGGLKILLDGPTGIIRGLAHIEAGEVDKVSQTNEGVRLISHGEIVIQRDGTTRSATDRVLDVRYGNTSAFTLTADGTTTTTAKMQTASTEEEDGPQTLVTKDYVDDKFAVPPSPWLELNGNLFPKELGNIVGIGTMTPQEHLHVEGNAVFSGYIQYDVDALPDLSTAGNNPFTPSNPQPTAGGISGASIDAPWTELNGNLFPTDISNKVGIGTTAPQEFLEVDGNAFFSGYIQYDVDALGSLP